MNLDQHYFIQNGGWLKKNQLHKNPINIAPNI
jgi:hypothetical protein